VITVKYTEFYGFRNWRLKHCLIENRHLHLVAKSCLCMMNTGVEYTGQQLVDIKRFGNQGGFAAIEQWINFLGDIVRGSDNDLYFRIQRPQHAQRFWAIHQWHLHVEHNHTNLIAILAKELNALFAAERSQGLQTSRTQQIGQRFQEQFFIINQQDCVCRGGVPIVYK